MASLSNRQIIHSIENGEESVLFYLTKKYFHSSRRMLRRAGLPDVLTPKVFSDVLIKVYREIQQNEFSENVDFEKYFMNSMKEALSNNNTKVSSSESDVVASCFSILDESAKKLISLRIVEKLSFESIAARQNFSNPVIAQFEFNKAYAQFEKMAGARINIDIE